MRVRKKDVFVLEVPLPGVALGQQQDRNVDGKSRLVQHYDFLKKKLFFANN